MRKLSLILLSSLFILTAPSLAATTTSPPADIDDADMTLAIERELLTQKGVSLDGLDIHTEDGIVTLRGSADHLMEKKRAENIAAMTKGVRSVVNLLEVEKTDLSSSELEAKVRNALLHDPATDSWEIEVTAKDSTVLLDGAVSSWQEKQLATRVAQATSGVQAVENNLTIDYDAPRSDYEIRTEIEQRLLWDARLVDGLIQVEVENGEVVLSGAVGSAYERTLAASNAWVRGVESVQTSELEVQWWARDEMQRQDRYADFSDGDIYSAIKTAFLYDPRVNSFNPDVEVTGGAVTLTGVVDNLEAKQAAAQDAANTAGVWRVRNHLKVRPIDERSDTLIAADVIARLADDPYVESYEVAVDVDDGIATLSGWTDSTFEKSQAAALAAKVDGVLKVENRIEVDQLPTYQDHDLYAWDPLTSTWAHDVADRVKSDWAIRQDIRDQLFWSPFVDSDQVSIDVNGGVATLTGAVDSWAERLEASEQALEGGAIQVENDLTVDSSFDWPIL